jgi:spore maturation protein CgeB
LLSKGNRDLHTQRSLEIPSLGGLLCAERTAEHLALYDEGKEAVFWQDAEECAEVCNRLLENETLRLEIAQRGLERAWRNNHFNEPVIASVIERAMGTYVEDLYG